MMMFIVRLLVVESRCSACRPQRSTAAQRPFLHLNRAARTLPRSGFVLPPSSALKKPNHFVAARDKSGDGCITDVLLGASMTLPFACHFAQRSAVRSTLSASL
jgi:hypothetical protein